MPEIYSIDRDLREAEAMAKGLAYYVRQDMLYGNVGSGGLFSGGDMPSLTIGALVMRIRRLSALKDHLNPQEAARLRKAHHRDGAVAREWQFHYEKKMLQEANSRLDAILPFFEEYERNPDLGVQVYKPEVLRRTIVQELIAVIEEHRLDTHELMTKMQTVDSRLRRCVEKTGFIWAKMLQPVYPEETYWWLYHRPVLRRM